MEGQLDNQGEVVKVFDLQSASEVIEKLELDDLFRLKRLIENRLDRISRQYRNRLLGQFSPGDRVRFKTSSGEEMTGIILRINQKTVSIDTGDGMGWWKVSPGLLEKI